MYSIFIIAHLIQYRICGIAGYGCFGNSHRQTYNTRSKRTAGVSQRVAVIVQGMAEADEGRRPPPPVSSRPYDGWGHCRDAFLPVERASSAHANVSETNTFTPKTNLPSNTISPSATALCIVQPLGGWATSIGVILRYLMWELPQGVYYIVSS